MPNVKHVILRHRAVTWCEVFAYASAFTMVTMSIMCMCVCQGTRASATWPHKLQLMLDSIAAFVARSVVPVAISVDHV